MMQNPKHPESADSAPDDNRQFPNREDFSQSLENANTGIDRKLAFELRFPGLFNSVFGCSEPNETLLTERNWSKPELFLEFKRSIERQYFEYHCPEPIPFADWRARRKGKNLLKSEAALDEFAKDVNGRKEYALLENANEKAFRKGIQEPYLLASSGKIGEALRSFGFALDDAPGRRAETYIMLARFCTTLEHLRRDLQSGTKAPVFGIQNCFTPAFSSSTLHTNLIVPEDPVTTKMIYGYVAGMLHGTHDALNVDFDPAAVEKALLESSVSFVDIARESCHKAIDALDNVPSNTAIEKYRESNRSQIRGILGGIEDNPNIALPRIEKRYRDALAGVTFPADECRDYVRVLKVLGRFDEAIKACSEALISLDHPDRFESFALELLRLCDARSKEPGCVQTFWELAYPYSSALLEDTSTEDIDEHRQYCHGLVLEGLGRTAEARQEFENALYEVEEKLDRSERRSNRSSKELVATKSAIKNKLSRIDTAASDEQAN